MPQEIKTLHWNELSDKKVQCQLCPHYCTLIPNEIGKCGVRINLNGELKSNVLDKCVSTNVDPIEKKPLYHFLPNSKAYSLATMGCNFTCDWCQNWQIAQLPSLNGNVFGDAIAPNTHILQVQQTGSKSIAYTYTEPTIFFEYALQIMQIAQQNNLFNLFITNGFITPTALADLLPFLSAANIDLKSFSNQTYRQHIGGRLQPVLDSIKIMHQAGVWIELTTLIIPSINDTEQELTEIAEVYSKRTRARCSLAYQSLYAYSSSQTPSTHTSQHTQTCQTNCQIRRPSLCLYRKYFHRNSSHSLSKM